MIVYMVVISGDRVFGVTDVHSIWTDLGVAIDVAADLRHEGVFYVAVQQVQLDEAVAPVEIWVDHDGSKEGLV